MANAPGGKAVDWTNPPPLGLEMIERRPGSSAGVRLGTFARRLFWRAYSASEVATPDDDGADAVTKGAIPRPVEHVPRDLGDSAEEDAADDPGAWTQNSQGPLPASMPGSEPDDYDSDATEVVDSDAAEVEASNAAEGEDNHPGPQPPRPGPPDTVSEGANTAASSPPQQPKLSKYERELQAASKINKEGLLLQGDRQCEQCQHFTPGRSNSIRDQLDCKIMKPNSVCACCKGGRVGCSFVPKRPRRRQAAEASRCQVI